MAGIFQRLFKTGQAEANALVDKLEDPIKMSEQAIRDLRGDLQGSLTALAEVKATAIRMGKDAEDSRRLGEDYERKAMLLLQRGQSGQLDQTEAERLARESLSRVEDAQKRHQTAAEQAGKQQEMVSKLQSNVNDLKGRISSYENDLVMLKARNKTANATRKINQHLASVDTNGTVNLLERMKEKVEEQEALAEAYGDTADSALGVDSQIDKALAGSGETKAEDSLARLKAKMGMLESGGPPT
jgi:phage shock protein A